MKFYFKGSVVEGIVDLVKAHRETGGAAEIDTVLPGARTYRTAMPVTAGIFKTHRQALKLSEQKKLFAEPRFAPPALPVGKSGH